LTRVFHFNKKIKMNIFSTYNFFTYYAFIVSLVEAQTALQERQKLKPEEFKFDPNLFKPTQGSGGSGLFATSENFPALKNTGVSSGTFELLPCAIGPPHLHPRSSELFHVLDGSFLTGFLEENGGRYIENNLTKGEMTVFPQGLVHFVQNLDCKNATFLSSFGSEDPGTLTLSTNLFRINQQALTSTFNQPDHIIDSIRITIPNPPAAGVGECRQRCGLPPIIKKTK
jgi:oxalate decarboxylase/phosphoglucose isomerase-like protein (cupin superfamily)